MKLEAIYARYRQGLFTLALSRTGCADLAEDAVHDAFVRLCRCDLDSVGDPVAYVFAAVRNTAADLIRRLSDRRAPAGEPSISIFDDRAVEPSANAVRVEQEQLIAAAVDALPSEQREIIVLRLYANLTFAQIAQVTGDPPGTVATRYRRGLQRLRNQLERLV